MKDSNQAPQVKPVQEGYMRNRKGHLVEEQFVDPYDLEMNAFVLRHLETSVANSNHASRVQASRL
ncbi:hypothetical protein [Aliivibrio wodanis]|uniref:hypothetical protein n=1 Tax=Aliivibrio wodanis TaxID=80852 RepID=UPI00406C04EE